MPATQRIKMGGATSRGSGREVAGAIMEHTIANSPPMGSSSATPSTSRTTAAIMMPCPWNIQETTSMERLIFSLIQSSRRVGFIESQKSSTSVSNSPHFCSFSEMRIMIQRAWPMRAEEATGPKIRSALEKLLVCAALMQETPLVSLEGGKFKVVNDPANKAMSFWTVWKSYPSVSKERLDTIVQRLEYLQQQDEAGQQSKQPSMKRKSPPGDETADDDRKILAKPSHASTTVTGSTVEERVRARAALRATQKKQHQVESQDPKHHLEQLLNTAQVIWSYARSLQQRQSSVFAASETRRPRLFRMSSSQPETRRPLGVVSSTLEDVVKVLHESTTGGMKKRLAVSLIHELCQKVPEWVLLSPSLTSSDPKATLWMFHDKKYKDMTYNHVSGKLSGKITKIVIDPPKTEHEGTASSAKASSSSSKNKDYGSKRSASTKRSLFNTNDQEGSDDNDSPRNKKIKSPQQPDQEPSADLPVKKPRPPKLRVNPHFILTDADYTGGERIVPRLQDSPRGLKGLFLQMKSGHRI